MHVIALFGDLKSKQSKKIVRKLTKHRGIETTEIYVRKRYLDAYESKDNCVPLNHDLSEVFHLKLADRKCLDFISKEFNSYIFSTSKSILITSRGI